MNIGGTTAGTGAFTTLSASSTVSGSGFSTYLASPPAIGGTTAAAGTFTSLTATSTVGLSPANANVTISPTGTGTVTISPAGALSVTGSSSLTLGTSGQTTTMNGNVTIASATITHNNSASAVLRTGYTTTADPAVTSAGTSLEFSRNIGGNTGSGRAMLYQQGPAGFALPFQVGLPNTHKWFAHPQTNTTTWSVWGGATLTAVGTATARAVTANGSSATRAQRIGYVGTAAANSQVGLYANTATTQTPFQIGNGTSGGFYAVYRFTIQDANAAGRVFIGFRPSTSVAAPTNIDWNSAANGQTNYVGVYAAASDNNWYATVGGTSAVAGQSMGTLGTITDTTVVWEVTIYNPPTSSTEIFFQVRKTGSTSVLNYRYSGTATTQLPSTSILLGPTIYKTSNATATTPQLDILTYYFESDFA